MNLMYFDGAPCAVKVACTVLGGGKSGDNFKGLPIAIRCEVPGYEAAHGRRRRCPHRHHSRTSAHRFVRLIPTRMYPKSKTNGSHSVIWVGAGKEGLTAYGQNS